jgi:hypothetical protein
MGAEDFATFVNKMYEAYDRYVKNALYDAMVGYKEKLATNFKKSGTLDAAELNALCDMIETATGYPVRIMGTRPALRKVAGLTGAEYLSNDMKNERYKTGLLGYFEGRDLIEIPQVFEKNKVGAYKLDNDLLWIMPASEEKFIKLVNEGDTQLRAITDKDTLMDMTYEQEMMTKLGVAVMLNGAFGMFDIEE